MTSIPGTSYQVADQGIVGPDGAPISNESFAEKVKAGEINLGKDALRFLTDELGANQVRELGLSDEQKVPTSELRQKVAGSGSPLADIEQLFVLMHKMTMEQRESSRTMRQAEFELQIGKLNDAAKEIMKAAGWRLAAGIASGTMSIVGGAMQVGGGMKALKVQGDAAKINAGPKPLSKADNMAVDMAPARAQSINNVAMGRGQIATGLGGMTASGFEFGASTHDKAKLEADAASKTFEQHVADDKEMMDVLREMAAKVREILASMENAEAEIARQIARS